MDLCILTSAVSNPGHWQLQGVEQANCCCPALSQPALTSLRTRQHQHLHSFRVCLLHQHQEPPFHPNMDTSDLLHRSIWLNPAVPSWEGLYTSLSGIPSFISVCSGDTDSEWQKLQINCPTPEGSVPTTGLLTSPCWHSRNMCSSSLSAQAANCAASGKV